MAELVPNINKIFFTGEIMGNYNHSAPVEVAKEVVSTLPDGPCAFMFVHNQSGVRLVYGYVYSFRRYGVVYIEQFSMGTRKIDINNSEYSLEE